MKARCSVYFRLDTRAQNRPRKVVSAMLRPENSERWTVYKWNGYDTRINLSGMGMQIW